MGKIVKAAIIGVIGVAAAAVLVVADYVRRTRVRDGDGDEDEEGAKVGEVWKLISGNANMSGLASVQTQYYPLVVVETVNATDITATQVFPLGGTFERIPRNKSIFPAQQFYQHYIAVTGGKVSDKPT